MRLQSVSGVMEEKIHRSAKRTLRDTCTQFPLIQFESLLLVDLYFQHYASCFYKKKMHTINYQTGKISNTGETDIY